jgi:hypothetical protein
MSEKVTPIRPDISVDRGEPQPKLAAMLRELADKADSGELQALIGTGLFEDGNCFFMQHTAPGADVYTLLGATVRLQHTFERWICLNEND